MKNKSGAMNGLHIPTRSRFVVTSKKHYPSATLVSVIVPTIGLPNLLRCALQSFVRQSFSYDQYEIVVVDNGEGEETLNITQDIAATTDVPIHYVREERKGQHYARHTGAEHSKGDILLYGEDDIVASYDWIESMYRAYSDGIYAVGGKVIPRWYGPVPKWIYAVGDERNCGPLGLLDLGEGEFELPANSFFCGGNFSIRASVFREVGGSNPEGFPAHLVHLRGDGEIGLLSKLRQRGLGIKYSSFAFVEHMVPENRLTFDYAVDRMSRQGISQGFSKSRETGGNILTLLVDSFMLGCGAVLYYAASKVALSEAKKMGWRLRSVYLSSRAIHELRIVKNRSLRAYTIKNSYW